MGREVVLEEILSSSANHTCEVMKMERCLKSLFETEFFSNLVLIIVSMKYCAYLTWNASVIFKIRIELSPLDLYSVYLLIIRRFCIVMVC